MLLSTLGPRSPFLQCPWLPLSTSTLWKLLLLDTTRALPLSLCSISYLYSRFKIIGLVFQSPNAGQEEGNPPEQMRSRSSRCLSVTAVKSGNGSWSFRLCFRQTSAGVGLTSQERAGEGTEATDHLELVLALCSGGHPHFGDCWCLGFLSCHSLPSPLFLWIWAWPFVKHRAKLGTDISFVTGNLSWLRLAQNKQTYIIAVCACY